MVLVQVRSKEQELVRSMAQELGHSMVPEQVRSMALVLVRSSKARSNRLLSLHAVWQTSHHRRSGLVRSSRSSRKVS
ncbi:hypothetical protein RSSM_05705 [Rhodopirellula sallentina SM41]|uniref:Uncharacterized protein n=1 Tax=Rhodopirellula sallentina SM41 TaxID=1263870 RepID=M5U4V8_9BACT|nr:hypothetical protein RSSM_05705 [Rhodopirellula sallentina SM41]